MQTLDIPSTLSFSLSWRDLSTLEEGKNTLRVKSHDIWLLIRYFFDVGLFRCSD
jgi:hypothetical protein